MPRPKKKPGSRRSQGHLRRRERKLSTTSRVGDFDMIIQERDQEILRNLSKYAVLSTHQIANLLFNGVTHTTMMRRLRGLEKAKYIHRGVPLDDGTNTWILGLEGRRLMNQMPTSVFMNRNTIEHDVLLTDVRMLLESLNLAKD